MTHKLSIIALFIFISLEIFAGDGYFDQNNDYVDQECPIWEISRFKSQAISWKTFGVQGAISYGYDFEVPVSRRGVDVLWCALVPDRGIDNKACDKTKVEFFSERPFARYANDAPIENTYDICFESLEDQYNHYYTYIRDVFIRENIDHPNVGSVLEILSRYFLQKLTDSFPDNQYTIGSGVSYSQTASSPTMGELDIIVYDRVTCNVLMIGESKASSPNNQRRSLNKARSQLNRFRNFLRRNGR